MATWPERFGDLNPDDDEFESVEALVEFIVDDDGEMFDWRHLQCLNYRLGRGTQAIRRELESYGLTIADRPKDRRLRTFSSNPHNRWHGNPCGGGSGWSNIVGLAGQEG